MQVMIHKRSLGYDTEGPCGDEQVDPVTRWQYSGAQQVYSQVRATWKYEVLGCTAAPFVHCFNICISDVSIHS